MCGIAGFYGFENKKLIKQFSKNLAHRGPDGEGIYSNERVSLLNRRLAIIDLKTGDQPIYNEDKNLVTVYNGEIYNYKQLRKELEDKGHRFKTLSDTEVIVHAYEEWGDNCFDKFNGMFAIALYDKKKDNLILARDHFGIKPLYFAILPNKHLLFASEIKPLLHSKLIKTRPNDKVIYRYLQYRVHDDTPETFFENIYRLMPGQYLSLRGTALKNGYFSNLEEDLKELSEKPHLNKVGKQEIQDFKAKLEEAIRLRLIADVPVGTCLSGGLDSSTVVSVVNSLLKNKSDEAKSVGSVQNTFSAVFPKSANDEERYIDELITMLKQAGGQIKSFKVHPQPEDFFTEIEDFVRTQEEPTISTGPYAQFAVMREASKHVKVLLDGQGADEMMAGYLPYYFIYLKQLQKQKKNGKLLREVLSSLDVISKFALLKLQLPFGKFKSDSIFNKSFYKKYSGNGFKVVKNNLKLRLIQDIFYNSLPSLLRYEDKNSMRFSIEGRVPFLDINLIKAIFSLPDEAIIQSGWNKRILRESVKDLLPNMIRNRRNKIGFTTPEEEWFMRMKNGIYSVFLSPSFAARPYFNQAQVLKGFEKFIEGKTADTLLFWRVLNIELWLREFFPNVNSSKASLQPVQKEPILEIKIGEQVYKRHVIKTDVFSKGDDYVRKIADHVLSSKLFSTKSKWFVVVSEKIVAISQGRSFFIWDIKTGLWAKLLSKYVTRTPYGIGLGSPWTMQLAIREVGLPKILGASIASAVTKPLGMKGIFYRIAGEAARSIDGPTEYSLYPSNVSAKLGPKNPQKVALDLADYLKDNLPTQAEKQFLGVVVIDANDLGRNVLGNSTNLTNDEVAEIFRDNPMGQGSEQTPISIVVKV